MGVENLWVGDLREDSFWVRGKVDGTSVSLLVSTSSDLSDPTTFGPVTPESHGSFDIASIRATGLDPDTQYHYAFEVDSVVDTDWQGKARTMGEEGMPYTFRFWSAACAGNSGGSFTSEGVSNAPVFDMIRNVEPLFGIHMGDLWYRDNQGTDLELYRDNYDRMLTFNGTEGADAKQGILYRQVPIFWQWDDHDCWGPNNADGNDIGKVQAQQVYRERAVHAPLVESDSIQFTFVCGRVRFIVPDTRSHRNVGGDENHLGANQLAWLIDLLETVEEPLIFLVWTVPWISSEDPQSSFYHEDAWGRWPGEREQIADAIWDNGLTDRIVFIGGDGHFLGWDDGTNSQYADGVTDPGPHVFQAAPMDCSTSVKGGPYSGGTTTSNHNWLDFRVVDNNDSIDLVVNLKTQSSDWHTEVLSFDAEPVELPEDPEDPAEPQGGFVRVGDGAYLRGGGGFLRARTPAS